MICAGRLGVLGRVMGSVGDRVDPILGVDGRLVRTVINLYLTQRVVCVTCISVTGIERIGVLSLVIISRRETQAPANRSDKFVWFS